MTAPETGDSQAPEILYKILYDADGNETTDPDKAVTGNVAMRMPNGEIMHTRLVSSKMMKDQ